MYCIKINALKEQSNQPVRNRQKRARLLARHTARPMNRGKRRSVEWASALPRIEPPLGQAR
jgi:hypothetical protein